jgi:lysine-specific histone demethylase 1
LVFWQDDHREALIAAGMGFPHNYLTEEEIRAGVVGALGGIEQSNYIVIRNHILAK